MNRPTRDYAMAMSKACRVVLTYIESERKKRGKASTEGEIKDKAMIACYAYDVTYKQMNRIMQF